MIATLFVVTLVVACSSDGSESRSGSGSTTTSTAESARAPVRVVTLNLLHGLFCPAETDACQAPDRVAIFAELVEEANCPELIGLQEIGPRLEELIPPMVETLCDGRYTIAWQAVDSPDRSMVLSGVPIIDRGYLDIANFPWDAYWVRVDAPPGPVDFLTTHFASSVNNPPCTPDLCPPICPSGITTNHCHAVEVADLFERRAPGAVISIVGGDLNATPGSPTVETLTEAGFRDAWIGSGRLECDPRTHVGCTAGGAEPEPFVGMNTEDGPGFDARIDYLLVRPEEGCDADIEAAGFANEPRSPPLDGMFWPSDHAGLQATIGCG